jgi:dGTPase
MERYLLDRPALEEREVATLAIFATASTAATRRHRLADEGRSFDYRLAFQRDRDRILHSRAFRRLKHKTQVFVPHLGDHQRTRLTHTLEVAQLGRTIARALALNEDLVEAIALGHDLGHTAFGHTGEAVLREILGGDREVGLPEAVTRQVGTFKHNYHSLRVVDLLERRYARPGLNLTDQVREGILKHTDWCVELDFPLPDAGGLRLDGPAHLEGQLVSLADEIAQQTHDLEDGLRAGSVDVRAVEGLTVARRIIERLGTAYSDQRSQYRRQNMLIRGMIHLLVTDAITASAARIEQFLEARGITDRETFAEHLDELPAAAVSFSEPTAALFAELKAFIYRFIINHPHVNRQDWRARKVLCGLFRAFWINPLNLPSYVLLRATEELGFPYLRDLPRPSVANEVAARYHTSPGFARLVVDHIAGMSDRFALEEYDALEHPSPGQERMGDVR